MSKGRNSRHIFDDPENIMSHDNITWQTYNSRLTQHTCVAGSTPYPGMGAREVMRKVRDGYRLERPAHCHPDLYAIIQKCWLGDMNKRPDFSELRKVTSIFKTKTKSVCLWIFLREF